MDDNVAWVQWRYAPGDEFRKARIENADDDKVVDVLNRCAAEFGAPISDAESLRMDEAYHRIMKARLASKPK